MKKFPPLALITYILTQKLKIEQKLYKSKWSHFIQYHTSKTMYVNKLFKVLFLCVTLFGVVLGGEYMRRDEVIRFKSHITSCI